jgi:hypothetical protein
MVDKLFCSATISHERRYAACEAALPTRDQPYLFEASFSIQWRVLDPAEVVRRQFRDLSASIQPDLVSRARDISRRFRISEAEAAESAINGELAAGDSIGVEYGLWIRIAVRLDPYGALKDLILETRPGRAESAGLNRDVLHPEDISAALEALRRQGEIDQASRLLRMDSVLLFGSLAAKISVGEELREALEAPHSQLAITSGEAKQQAAEPTAREAVQAAPEPETVPEPTYDDLARSVFGELVQPGRLLFNPPTRMQLSETVRVEVRLTRTLDLDDELFKNLRGPGEPQVENIRTAPLMAVTLKGDGFKVTGLQRRGTASHARPDHDLGVRYPGPQARPAAPGPLRQLAYTHSRPARGASEHSGP